ncbi:MAG TPA: site-specific integrase [Chthoniobacteraceae bacterium]|nr:site-specific integrase [Chthoniobacteraceae bacterium]
MTAEALLFDRRGNRKYLNAEERKLFYRQAMLLPHAEERSFALMLFYTGCRISEALAFTRSNLDQAESVAVFRTLKQRAKLRYRAVPIPESFVRLLEKQAAPLAENEPLWGFCRSTGWKIVKRCMNSADLKGIKATPKGLRHGFAVAGVSAHVPLPLLQRWLGHSNLQTTSIYLDFIGEDERAFAERIWANHAK